jgi:ParB-like chromosome segregation protein Spo0J
MVYDSAIGTSEEHRFESIPDMAVELLPVDSLQTFDSPRLAGENLEHTRMLANVDTKLPPIIVHRATMRVIDGTHRLGAARLRGDVLIEARMFDGSEQEAFVLGVQANITHGLPLSVPDRTLAAERIIEANPTWSDRAIASATGLGARTIGTIRRRLQAESGGEGQIKARIGRDGRVRPLDNTEGRLRAVDFIKRQPDASLREIARNAGVSPSTARDVRNRIERGEDPFPSAGRPVSHRGTMLTLERPSRGDRRDLESDITTKLRGLRDDPSLRFTESGRALLRWVFMRTVRQNEWHDIVSAVPPHCTYVMADVARHCANEWLELADTLEKQSAKSA